MPLHSNNESTYLNMTAIDGYILLYELMHLVQYFSAWKSKWNILSFLKDLLESEKEWMNLCHGSISNATHILTVYLPSIKFLMQINIQKFQARILLKNMNEGTAFIIWLIWQT